MDGYVKVQFFFSLVCSAQVTNHQSQIYWDLYEKHASNVTHF